MSKKKEMNSQEKKSNKLRRNIIFLEIKVINDRETI